MASYNANTNWDNESKYLDSLIAQGGGNAEWAKKQKNELNAAKQQYSSAAASGSTSQKSSSGSSAYAAASDSGTSQRAASSGNSYAAASGSTKSASGGSSGYNANTNWDNETSYLNGLIAQGGGQAEWAKQQLKTLRSAQQQYTGTSAATAATDEEAALRNRYFPGYETTPSNVNLAAGTVTAPNGDVLQLHDWSTDTTDYGAQMLNAQTIDEFREAAQARVNKANAQGIDIYGSGTARTNEDLYNEWRQKTGYAPNYGDYMYKGWGYDSTTGEEGYIQNAGQGTGYYGMDSEGHWGYYADPELTQKLANGTWDDYASSDGGYVRMDDTGQPDMTEQDLSRAGQTVILTSPKGTWRCTYNNNGYITARVRTSSSYTYGLTPAKADSDAGVSSEELLYLETGQRYTGAGSTVKNSDVKAASRADYQDAMTSRAQSGTGPVYGSTNTSGGSSSGTNGSLAAGSEEDALSAALGNAMGTGTGSSAGTTSGTSGTSGSGYDLSEYLKKQYESALESELAGLKSAYEQNSASLDDEEARLGGIYDPERNRAAAQSALAKKAWDERAAANGLNSGTSGQAELARASTLQRDLASIGEEEANAYADLSLRKRNLTIEYTNAVAEAKANGQSELAAALYNELVRVQGLEREDEIRESEQALELAQTQMEYDLALKQAEAESAAAQTESKPSLTASQAYTAYKNGIRTDEVMTAMNYYYGIGGGASDTAGTTSTGTTSTGTTKSTGTSTTTGSYNANTDWDNEAAYLNSLIAKGGGNAEWAKKQLEVLRSAQKQYTGKTTVKTTAAGSTGSSSSSGYNESYFNAALSSLSTMLAQGKTDSAVSGIDSFWSKLSDVQKSSVQTLLGKYGLKYTEG